MVWMKLSAIALAMGSSYFACIYESVETQKDFISGGSKVELLPEPAVDRDVIEVDAENEPESRGGSVHLMTRWSKHYPHYPTPKGQFVFHGRVFWNCKRIGNP